VTRSTKLFIKKLITNLFFIIVCVMLTWQTLGPSIKRMLTTTPEEDQPIIIQRIVIDTYEGLARVNRQHVVYLETPLRFMLVLRIHMDGTYFDYMMEVPQRYWARVEVGQAIDLTDPDLQPAEPEPEPEPEPELELELEPTEETDD